jgi:hypothetical protein
MKYLAIVILALSLTACKELTPKPEPQTYYEAVKYAGDVAVERFYVTNYNTRFLENQILYQGRWVECGENTRIRLMPGYHGPEAHEVLVK